MSRMPPSLLARRPRVTGFSLIELMVVVAILAVLSAIAMPVYKDYVIRGKLSEARNILMHYRVAMEQYYQDHRAYADSTGTSCGALFMRADFFTFSCVPTADGQGYTAAATGKGDGGVDGFRFTIDERGERRTAALPPGWGAPSDLCWVSRKGGACQ